MKIATNDILAFAIKNKVTLSVASRELTGRPNLIHDRIYKLNKRVASNKAPSWYDVFLKLKKQYDEINFDNVTTVSKKVKKQQDPIQVVDDEIIMSAFKDGKNMSIDDYCNEYNLPRNLIKSWKLITHTGKPFYNIHFKESVELTDDFNFDFIESIVKKHTKQIKVDNLGIKYESSSTFDRLVMTDVHIGMNPNANGNALYDLKWGKEELMKRLDCVTNTILEKQNSDTLVIDELGDYLDGWDGQTTRGGHKLPQNMDNCEAFDTAVLFKVKLIDSIVDHYDFITMNNVCEDNHSGDFGYIVNSTVKNILEMKYPDHVVVNNNRKFMEHYIIGKHCFILTHGKDSKHMKFGLKPHLKPDQAEKIDQYCKQNKIYNKCEFVELSKGDSHQTIFDAATSDDFDYFNYPAFSPSSEWVQTNFKVGRSGFVFGNIELENNVKNMTTYWF